jgi:hypothetical protein
LEASISPNSPGTVDGRKASNPETPEKTNKLKGLSYLNTFLSEGYGRMEGK